MANKNFWVGILAIGLVFGMLIFSCDTGSISDSGNSSGETGGNSSGETGGNTNGETGGNTGGETGGNTGGETSGLDGIWYPSGNGYRFYFDDGNFEHTINGNLYRKGTYSNTTDSITMIVTHVHSDYFSSYTWLESSTWYSRDEFKIAWQDYYRDLYRSQYQQAYDLYVTYYGVSQANEMFITFYGTADINSLVDVAVAQSEMMIESSLNSFFPAPSTESISLNDNTLILGNVTLTRFNSNTAFTITFDLNGATGTTPISHTVNSNSNITLPSSNGFSRTHHTFSGWNTSANGDGINYNENSSYTVNGNVTLYANWQTNTFTVTFDINGATNGVAPAAQTVAAGSIITLPDGDDLSRNGFIFSGWNTNDTGTGTNYNSGSSYTVTRNITLYARWTIDIYSGSYYRYYEGGMGSLTFNNNGTYIETAGTYSVPVSTGGTYTISGNTINMIMTWVSWNNNTFSFQSQAAIIDPFTIQTGNTIWRK